MGQGSIEVGGIRDELGSFINDSEGLLRIRSFAKWKVGTVVVKVSIIVLILSRLTLVNTLALSMISSITVSLILVANLRYDQVCFPQLTSLNVNVVIAYP